MELRLDFSIDLIMIEFGVKGMMGEIDEWEWFSFSLTN